MSDNKVVITLDDVSRVRDEPRPASAPITPTGASGSRDWGTVHGAQGSNSGVSSSSGNPFYKSWVYLPLAGLLGTLIGWAVCEPFFFDDGPKGFGNWALFTLSVALMCVAFASAEAIVERNPLKALVRGGIALLAAAVIVPVCEYGANVIYRALLMRIGDFTIASPSLWLTRSAAWSLFGAAGGLVYGIGGRSLKQCLFGLIGGVLGAAVGGLTFDPLGMVTQHGGASRMVGLSAFGIATGLAIGLVENALKNRWLYVAQGPLAGKQFILYKPVTVFGNDRACDIYLFKDPTILPQHAAIQVQGAQAMLTAAGPTTINGRPVITPNVRLRSGDQVQIGRYVFRYEETNKVA